MLTAFCPTPFLPKPLVRLKYLINVCMRQILEKIPLWWRKDTHSNSREIRFHSQHISAFSLKNLSLLLCDNILPMNRKKSCPQHPRGSKEVILYFHHLLCSLLPGGLRCPQLHSVVVRCYKPSLMQTRWGGFESQHEGVLRSVHSSCSSP